MLSPVAPGGLGRAAAETLGDNQSRLVKGGPVRRFLVLISILAATAPFSARAVNCGGPPFNSLPPDACKAIPNLPAQGCRGPLPANVCNALPPALRPPAMQAGSDQNVLVVNNSFNPADITIVVGLRLFFQNADLATHTVYYDGCDTVGNAPCFHFDPLALTPDAWGIGAKGFNITPASYVVGQVYHFKCTIQAGMKGSFTIA